MHEWDATHHSESNTHTLSLRSQTISYVHPLDHLCRIENSFGRQPLRNMCQLEGRITNDHVSSDSINAWAHNIHVLYVYRALISRPTTPTYIKWNKPVTSASCVTRGVEIILSKSRLWTSTFDTMLGAINSLIN